MVGVDRDGWKMKTKKSARKVNKGQFHNKYMTKFTSLLEPATRKKIDLSLDKLDWVTDEESHNCNVFTERAKTKEQNKKFKGKQPDYVLYKSGTDEPIAIIEAKRKGQSIQKALEQGIEKYAIPIKVDIVFAIDGAFIKSWSIKSNEELFLDGEPLKELISEKRLLRFIKEGNKIEEVAEEVKHTREELIRIFKWANDLLRKEGLRNLDRFVEFSNILFIKIISEIEEDREKRGLQIQLDKSIRWDSFCEEKDSKKMLNYINDTVLKNGLANEYNHTDDIFQEKLKIQNPETIKEIVNKLSNLKLLNTESEIKGDAFEYFLKSLASGNDLGEYFSPRHIVKMMVKLINPKYGNNIFDPFCGTGGFLIESFRHIKKGIDENDDKFMKKLREDSIFGVELTDTYKIAKMNMIITGDGHNNIVQDDVAKLKFWDKLKENEKNNKEKLKNIKDLEEKGFNVIFSNIPYGQTTDFGNLYPITTPKGDSIFLQLILKELSDNGVASVIVPHGEIISNTSNKSIINTRKYLLENSDLFAVISLPRHVFEPYTSVKTDILFFRKGKPTKKVWFFRVDDDGFELNANRRKIDGKNDLDLIYEIWEDKTKTEKSFYVDIQKIKDNQYRLDIECYEENKIKRFNCETKKISDIADIIQGYAFKSNKYVGDGSPIVRIQNIQNGKIVGDFIHYPKKEMEKLQKYLIKNKDILLVLTRPVIKSLIKKVAFYNKNEELYLNQRIGIIRAKNKNEVLPEYLFFFFFSDYYMKKIKSLTKGQLQPNVNITDLENLQIPIPSIQKQKEIVDKLMFYYRNIKNIDEVLDNYSGIFVNDDLFSGFEREDLTNLCLNVSETIKSYEGKKKYLTTGNIIGNKIIDLDEYSFMDKPSRAKLTTKENDVIFAKMKDTHKSLFITESEKDFIFSTGFFVLRVKDTNKLLPQFLYYYINTNEFQKIRDSLVKGSTQEAMNNEGLKEIKIPIPQLQKQQKIITKIEEKLNLIKEMEKLKEKEIEDINLVLENL